MAAELTGSQNRIFRGPAWSGQNTQQYNDPLAARVNVACLSTQTVSLHLAQLSSISTEPVIQVRVLAYYAD